MITLQHYRIKDPETHEVYLERWSLNFWDLFSLKIHRIWRHDFGRHLHDHPWWFLTFLLTGGYVEEIWDRGVMRTLRNVRGRIRFRSTRNRHRIISVTHPCWTFVVCGARVREWGFWVDGRLVPHAEYEKSGYTEDQRRRIYD